jgi:hypothetical protein
MALVHYSFRVDTFKVLFMLITAIKFESVLLGLQVFPLGGNSLC